MLVYRLEHKDSHIGPYKHYRMQQPNKFLQLMGQYDEPDFIDDMGLVHNENRHGRTPAPPDDFTKEQIDSLEGRCSQFQFGFATRKDLKHWFYGYLGGLKKLGFQVAEYNVPDDSVVVGGHQLAFETSKGERV